MTRILAFFAAAGMAAALAGCGASAKGYDISPIFPLSADKCARYDGHQEGSGITAKCMVSKAECVKAAADWSAAMESGGVDDAIDFSCK